jgi:hypothetical protein
MMPSGGIYRQQVPISPGAAYLGSERDIRHVFPKVLEVLDLHSVAGDREDKVVHENAALHGDARKHGPRAGY